MSDGVTLVTGATGLLGRRLVPRLSGEVHTVSRSAADWTHHHVVDLANRADADELVRTVVPDRVIHLAGGPQDDVVALYRANVLTTVRILDAVVAHAPAAHTLIVGSAAELGEWIDTKARGSLEPVTAYGRAKLAATTSARAIAASHSIELAVARPFNVVANDLPRSSALGNIRAQLAESDTNPRVVLCGRLDVTRDFVDADQVVGALMGLSRLRFNGQVDVCSGKGTVLSQIVDEASFLLGVELDIKTDPDLAAIPAANQVIGDPSVLESLGLGIETTPRRLAEALLAPPR